MDQWYCGLPTEVRLDQQVRVGQEAPGAGETAERRLGVASRRRFSEEISTVRGIGRGK